MTLMEYNSREIEKKWQEYWERKEVYKTPEKGEKFYHLVMFPYPSGDLHIGHWYNFVGGDVYARKKRMEGYRVMSPIGFDAFGLPAENAAIKRNIHPEEWTHKNIERMRDQIRAMGPVYDWEREVVTCSPDYYKWTQWLFLKLFKKGLAYKKKAPANFCPSCLTVLANEQVVEGLCERCDASVEQKEIEQWLFNVRKYADELDSALEEVDWPERTKAMQRNWIGKSEGAVIKFPIPGFQSLVDVFTTRPDTIFGATYLVLSPEHPFLKEAKGKMENTEEVEEYIEKAKNRSERERISEEKEKTGVEIKGVKAVNPANKEEIPVFVADYVLMHYGTGAIMAVPAHDKRDFSFAEKHELPITRVISGGEELPYEGEGELVNSGDFTGVYSDKAKEEIVNFLEKGERAEKKTSYKIRDWLISRQRYWGAPIPVVHCSKCGSVPVPEEDLPVELPSLKDFSPTKEGRSPLAKAEEFYKTACPECGEEAERETDTMDTFVCSSWYYIRYTDPKNEKEFANREKIDEWLPVDIYIGGAEHTVLHLLYSRFVTKALRDMGYLSFSEPFQKLRHQGIILGADGQKMSKSKGNVVDPAKEVEKYGVDSVRMYLCFMGPYEQGGPWDPQGVKGVRRFLERVWKLREVTQEKDDEDLEKEVHKAIKKVTEDIEGMRFNTAISALMTLLNEMKKPGKGQVKTFLLLLFPFAPHFASEMWSLMDFEGEIEEKEWPHYDKEKIKEEEVTVVLQIDGKTRDTLLLKRDTQEEELEKAALANEKTKKWIEGKSIKKVIAIKNKLVNIVTK